MPVLDGRSGKSSWNVQILRHDNAYDGSWVVHRLGPREAGMSSVEHATRWFTLQGLGCFEHLKEASKVREVVVVTHNKFLQDFFGAGK
jgi:hypothetical protein